MLEYKNHMTQGFIIASYYHPNILNKVFDLFCVGWTVDFLAFLLSYSYQFQMAFYDHISKELLSYMELALKIHFFFPLYGYIYALKNEIIPQRKLLCIFHYQLVKLAPP